MGYTGIVESSSNKGSTLKLGAQEG